MIAIVLGKKDKIFPAQLVKETLSAYDTVAQGLNRISASDLILEIDGTHDVLYTHPVQVASSVAQVLNRLKNPVFY